MGEREDGAVCTVLALSCLADSPTTTPSGRHPVDGVSKVRISRTGLLDDRVADGALLALWKKDERGNRELAEDGLIES